MRIGIISSLPKKTGAYTRGEYFANALRKQGHYVKYFNPQPRMPFKLEHLIFSFINIFRYSFKRYDYLFVLKPYPVGMIPAILNRFFTGSKIVVDIDDLDSSYNEGFEGKIIEWMQKYLPKYFDLVTILDNDDLIKYVGKKWKVNKNKMIAIEQGVNTDLFDITYKKAKGGEKIFMFTGHLAKTVIIELSTLLDIFKEFNKNYKDTRLVIVGGGSCLELFKAKVKGMGLSDKVSFTGYVRSKDVINYLGKADVCLCYYADRLSNYYRNSMKIREYLSAGKLVVCTNIGDLKKFGKYTMQTDATKESFLQGMIKAYNKESSRKDVLERRKFIKQGFSWEGIGKKISQRLEEDVKLK